MTVDKKQVERIVEQVLERLSVAETATSPGNHEDNAGGVFQEMEDAIQAAVIAHQQLLQLPLAPREKIIQAIRDEGWANREEYARMELEETDLGAVSGTVLKLETACGVPGIERTEGNRLLRPRQCLLPHWRVRQGHR